MADKTEKADIGTTLETVNLREAASLVHRTERNIRRQLRRGTLPYKGDGKERNGAGYPRLKIKVADLAAIPGWTVDPDALTRLQLQKQTIATVEASPNNALVETVLQLRQQIVNLQVQVKALQERPERPPAPIYIPTPVVTSRPAPTPKPPPVRKARPTMPLASFPTREQGLSWLSQHGTWGSATPKTWQGRKNGSIGWRNVNPTKRELLALAISEYEPMNWKRGWHLQRCPDSLCPCYELLNADGQPIEAAVVAETT